MDFRKPGTLLLFLLGFFLVSALLLYIVASDGEIIGTYGVNKTIGWAWDISKFCFEVLYYIITCILVFFIGYTGILILKGSVNRIISILHLIVTICALGLATTTTYLENYCIYAIVLSVISIGLMAANVMAAIRYEKSGR